MLLFRTNNFASFCYQIEINGDNYRFYWKTVN